MTRIKEKILPDNKPINSKTFQQQTHKNTVLNGLKILWEKGELLDVAFRIEDKIFKAHKVVLSVCSDYFRAMFTNNMLESRQEEICLNGISAEGFRQILKFAYTSKIKLNLGNVQEVLEAASHIQIEPVIQACSKYLLLQIDIDNCIDIATIAEMYSLKELRLMVDKFISEHLLEFSRSEEFYRLTPQQLENLLALNFAVDCSEADVLTTVLTWFFHMNTLKKELSASYAMRIIHHIRFQEISRQNLERVLSKMFEDFNIDIDLYKLVSTEAYLQLNSCKNLSTSNLLSSRGMEQAILKIGGFGISGITNEITYCFTSDRNWKHLTNIPHLEQCNFGTAVLNNELFIVGGCYNQSLQENIHPFGFKYSSRYNKWSTMSPMTIERCRFSLNVLGNMLYAVGGASEVDEYGTSTCERYDPILDMWLMIHPIPINITQHAGASYEDNSELKLFISGGIDRDSTQSGLYCYIVNENRWQQCAPMLRTRADHVMLSIGDCLYVCGGWTESPEMRNRILVDTIDVYDVRNNRWQVVTTVPTPRYHAGIVCVDRKIYFIGGFYSEDMLDKSLAAIEFYDLDNQTWTIEDKYPHVIWEHTCATLSIPKWRDDMKVVHMEVIGTPGSSV